MLKLFEQVNKGTKIDFITLNGDLVAHRVAQDWGESPEVVAPNYKFLLETHAVVQ
tara:strand:+ start:364 stop:528 length:165 start_codon:yes stop_codon:yes gene_type:complete